MSKIVINNSYRSLTIQLLFLINKKKYLTLNIFLPVMVY